MIKIIFIFHFFHDIIKKKCWCYIKTMKRIKENISNEIIINNSRFITHLIKVYNEEQALKEISDVKSNIRMQPLLLCLCNRQYNKI